MGLNLWKQSALHTTSCPQASSQWRSYIPKNTGFCHVRNSLVRSKIFPLFIMNDISHDPTCCVCTASLTLGPVQMLSCGHTLHKACLSRHVAARLAAARRARGEGRPATHMKCPLCRPPLMQSLVSECINSQPLPLSITLAMPTLLRGF